MMGRILCWCTVGVLFGVIEDARLVIKLGISIYSTFLRLPFGAGAIRGV